MTEHDTSLRGLQDVLESIQVRYDSDKDTEIDSDDSDYDVLSAQQQWEQSVGQIKLLINQVLFPLMGKVIGRRFAHTIWGMLAEWIYK